MNNEIQSRIGQLVEKGWTLAAIADELDVTPDTVENWRAGRRNATNAKAISAMLDKLLKKKRIPKQRRYAKGSRQQKGGNPAINHEQSGLFEDEKQ